MNSKVHRHMNMRMRKFEQQKPLVQRKLKEKRRELMRVSYDFRANIKSNLRTNEKREETNENTYDYSNSPANIRQVQDDLAKLTQSLEEVKGDLKVLLEVRN